jgi:sulfur carrier protein ThiS
MIRLALSAPLFALIPDEERTGAVGRREVPLEAESWNAVVEELRTRFPTLARYALTDSGAIASGFVLVVNDEVMPRGQQTFEVRGGDRLSLLAAMAGG